MTAYLAIVVAFGLGVIMTLAATFFLLFILLQLLPHFRHKPSSSRAFKLSPWQLRRLTRIKPDQSIIESVYKLQHQGFIILSDRQLNHSQKDGDDDDDIDAADVLQPHSTTITPHHETMPRQNVASSYHSLSLRSALVLVRTPTPTC